MLHPNTYTPTGDSKYSFSLLPFSEYTQKGRHNGQWSTEHSKRIRVLQKKGYYTEKPL